MSSPMTGTPGSNIIKPSILKNSEHITTNSPEDDGWQTVRRKKKSNIRYNIPVLNIFEGLCETGDKESSEKDEIIFKCDISNFMFSTNSMLKTHMKIHKQKSFNMDDCKCTSSKNYNEAIQEVKLLRSHLEQLKNEMKTLKEYKDLKTCENEQSSETQTGKAQEVRQSVISYKCNKCVFVTKSLNPLNSHK